MISNVKMNFMSFCWLKDDKEQIKIFLSFLFKVSFVLLYSEKPYGSSLIMLIPLRLYV